VSKISRKFYKRNSLFIIQEGNSEIEILATFYGTIYKSIERFVMPGS